MILIDNIPEWMKQRLSEYGGIFDSSYVDYLISCRLPEVGKVHLSSLMNRDLLTQKLFLKKGSRKIIQYDYSGKECAIYDSLIEAGKTPNAKKYLYSYDSDVKLVPTRKGISVFGLKVKPLYDQMSYKNIDVHILNTIVYRFADWNAKKSPREQKRYAQLMRYYNLAFGDFVFEQYKYLNDLRGRCKQDYAEFDRCFDHLKDYYLLNGNQKIEQVSDLSQFSGVSGIYFLVMRDFPCLYIGQSSNIKTRIMQHFWQKNPQSRFDMTFGLIDVNDIYVLKCDAKYLNEVETNCIGGIPGRFLVNSMVGGDQIAFLNHDESPSLL